ncbi:HIG1 domain-containing protein [Sphingomicrobium sp. XHP0239]|uniref:HIG1 domain-containing protein n=1 Tax=Sphingomicrobium maritimum TaxID=3133972 RepID=UPI0031CC8D27
MTTILILLLVGLMAATAYVLVRGVMAMASGKDMNGAKQQNYMQKRVLYQGFAIIVIAIILAVSR